MNLFQKIKISSRVALLHSPLLFVFIIPWGQEELILLIVMLLLMGVGVELGYHRFFSHRSFKTHRWFQFILAVLGTLSLQRGPLWWAATHREHHRFTDKEGDPHSPIHGFIRSHLWWCYQDGMCKTEMNRVKDWKMFPELKFLDRFDNAIPCIFVIVIALFTHGEFHSNGFYNLGIITIVYALAALIIAHVFFTINSVGHLKSSVIGYQNYKVKDNSKNLVFFVILSLGACWHNNHHRFPSSSTTQVHWWELDCGYLILRLLSVFSICWDLKLPSKTTRRCKS